MEFSDAEAYFQNLPGSQTFSLALKVSTCQQTDSLDVVIVLFSLFLRVAVDLKRGLTDYLKVVKVSERVCLISAGKKGEHRWFHTSNFWGSS